MKLMGIDYGRRRIGVAVTDETGRYIRGLPTIDRKTSPEYFKVLDDLIKAEAPGRLVAGLPLDMDGRDTEMSLEARSFAVEAGRRSSVPVAFVDESLSSVQAGRLMLHKKKKDRRSKPAVDKIAACLILETYLREQGRS